MLDRMEQRAVLILDGRRHAGRHEGHVDDQLLGHPNEEQVDMDRTPVHRVDLDAVDEDRTGLLAVDGQVDQRVLAGLAPEELELMGVDRDVFGIEAAAEDDGRKPAASAKDGDLLAELLARLGREAQAGRGGGGHRSGTSVWSTDGGARSPTEQSGRPKSGPTLSRGPRATKCGEALRPGAAGTRDGPAVGERHGRCTLPA